MKPVEAQPEPAPRNVVVVGSAVAGVGASTLAALLARELTACPCVERVYPSQTNFLLLRTPAPDALYDALIGAGVIVRNRSRIGVC